MVIRVTRESSITALILYSILSTDHFLLSNPMLYTFQCGSATAGVFGEGTSPKRKNPGS